MVNVRIEQKNNFSIIGRKMYITKLEQFSEFWKKSHESGLIKKLNQIREIHGCPITNGTHIGLSCTEKDPDNRNFYFFISVEYPCKCDGMKDLEIYNVASFKWAVFSKNCTEINALFDCEMYAFKEWLPTSKYEHDFGPEMEVYHNNKIEFWLPIIGKKLFQPLKKK
ncbi:MAG: effector binding domain-containing protein [Spirochaetales bacterium]|nr:effector binding domain-containing protein [Spirochaetales bacterium]